MTKKVPPFPRLHVSEGSAASSTEHQEATQGTELIAALIQKINLLESALWRSEAELAIGVPVSPQRSDESHLAERLEIMLKNGAEAVGCSAAGLYMLDDTTSELKLRACWGMPKDRLLEPARPLEGAFADLEALIGHAVVLDDASLLPNWKTPETFPAAICLPVSSPSDPLGTLWFFAEEVRPFSNHEIHLAEMIAGSIASELQREVLLGECLASKQANRQIVHGVQWQQDRLPTITPFSEDWEVSGWSAEGDELVGSYYDWFVPPDGSIAVVVGACEERSFQSALSAAALQATVRAHSEHPHNAATMLSRVNESIWNASATGAAASLFYCKAASDSNEIEYATGGTIQAILVRESKAELLHPDSQPLGRSPGRNIDLNRVHLQQDELLLLLSTTSDSSSLQLELSRQLHAMRTENMDKVLELVHSVDSGTDAAMIIRHR